MKSLLNEQFIACDLETDSLNVREANIIGISIAFSQDAVYIPFISPENSINKKDQYSILKILNDITNYIVVILRNPLYGI